MTSSRHRQARPQQPGDGPPGVLVEHREHRHAADEIVAFQAEVEDGARFDGAPAPAQLALQILVHVLVDDRLGSQPAIAFLFKARRRAGQVLGAELAHIVRILQLESRDRAVDLAQAQLDLPRHGGAGSAAEQRPDLLAIEDDQVFQHDAGGELHLEAVGELARQRAGYADLTMQHQGQAKAGAEAAQPRCDLLIAVDAVRADAVAQPGRVREQYRRHPARHGSPLEIFEAEFLLAVGQYHQRRARPEFRRQLRVLFGDVGGIAVAGAIDRGDLVDHLRRDLVLARDGRDLVPGSTPATG